MKHPVLLPLVLLILPVPSVFSADWPQWQGPDRNAISKEKGLLQEWPKDGPPLVRKVTGIGGGGQCAVHRCGEDLWDESPRGG